MESAVADPAKPIRLWQRGWVKYASTTIGIIVFIGLLTLNLIQGCGHTTWNFLTLGAAATFGVSAGLVVIDPDLDFEWNGAFSKWLRRIAWTLILSATVLTFSYVQAWSADGQHLVIVKKGRTNLSGSFFVNPFSRGKVVIDGFETAKEVAWNSDRDAATRMSARFRVIPDEELALAVAARGNDVGKRLEFAAQTCLQKLFEKLIERKTTILDVAETKRLEYWPSPGERRCAGTEEILSIRLVGPVTLSDSAGLPVEKVWFRD